VPRRLFSGFDISAFQDQEFYKPDFRPLKRSQQGQDQRRLLGLVRLGWVQLHDFRLIHQ